MAKKNEVLHIQRKLHDKYPTQSGFIFSSEKAKNLTNTTKNEEHHATRCTRKQEQDEMNKKYIHSTTWEVSIEVMELQNILWWFYWKVFRLLITLISLCWFTRQLWPSDNFPLVFWWRYAIILQWENCGFVFHHVPEIRFC